MVYWFRLGCHASTVTAFSFCDVVDAIGDLFGGYPVGFQPLDQPIY